MREPKNKDFVEATVDDTQLSLKPGKTGKVRFKVGPDGTVNLPSKMSPPLTFDFSKLSPGAFTSLTVQDGAAKLEGTISPSARFLPRKLEVVAQNDKFSLVAPLDKKHLGATPIPGFHLTDESRLELQLAPDFAASGVLGFALGRGDPPFAHGNVKVGADAKGLNASGDIFVRFPGLDRAQLHVEYREGDWMGVLDIEASKINVPFVKGGAVQVRIELEGPERQRQARHASARKQPSATAAELRRRALALRRQRPFQDRLALPRPHRGEHRL